MRILRVAGFIPAVFLLALGGAAHADPDDEGPDPTAIPLVGRPDLPFSEASGRFTVSAHAEPTTVQVRKPLTFTLRVKATGPVVRPPQRIDLRKLKTFTDRFYVEDPDDGSRHPDARTWEFIYRLKPRRADVTEVPGLPFAYYNPALHAEGENAFQVPYTDAIQLTVKPATVVAVPLKAPEGAFRLATGPDVLARRRPWSLPGPWASAALVLAPPLLCAGWYAWWRRRYPDAARRASQRRSRAAREALTLLRGAARLAPAERAARTATAVAGYLRQRLDLTAAEPTPAEVADLLTRHGCSAALTGQATGLFKACDAARFLPEATGDAGLADAAAQLVLAVEAETCAPPRS